ncbi:heavy metal sensor histidine kinase [Roseateles sp.]|uniref:heavy metal sensor histidine kinase n=1 Tax=Roseateles sp. TaxID=1971397 RepID=UPI003BAD2A7C
MRPRALGLVARMALGAALGAALLTALLGGLTYAALAQQWVRSDERALLGKLRQVSTLLAQSASPGLLIEQPRYLRDSMSGEGNAIVRLLGADGRLLLEINAAGLALPAAPPVADAERASVDSLVHWQTAAGTPAAVVSAQGRLGPAPQGQAVLITVARVFHERDDALRANRRQLAGLAALVALASGLAAAAAMAWVLRPLRRLAHEAADVRIDRLERRLNVPALPEFAGLAQAVNRMLDRLQQGFERLSGFAADLAHELRTPLGNLRGQTQVALAHPRDAHSYRQLLESNLEEFERLQRMTDGMLFLARADHGHVALAFQALDAAAELRRQADYFEDLADERGLRLLVQAAPAGGPPLQADPTLLRRALANVVSNAIRHAQAPGDVVLQGRREPGAWLLTISNPALPLDPPRLDQLFERFYRADPARPGSSQGAGLGLSIVRSILQLHGGSATVSQAEGRLTLALRWPDAAGPPP